MDYFSGSIGAASPTSGAAFSSPAQASGPHGRALAEDLPHFPKANSPLVLGQNVPNPHTGETCIPFSLTQPADVRLELYDSLGRKMATVVRKGLGIGEHTIQLNLCGLSLPFGDYRYHLQATTVQGTHVHQCVMTLV